jgi:1,4-alpha-glucan branching enzyme
MVIGTRKSRLTRRTVQFTFQAPPYARQVALAGDFNAWNQRHSTMGRAPSGVWEITMTLAPGRYQYKFLVNAKEWFADPKAQASAPNPYGDNNSVIEVK